MLSRTFNKEKNCWLGTRQKISKSYEQNRIVQMLILALGGWMPLRPQPPSPSIHKTHCKVQQAGWVVVERGIPQVPTPQVQRGRRMGGGDGEGLGAITPPAPSPQPPSPSIHKAHGKVQQAGWVVVERGIPQVQREGEKGGWGSWVPSRHQPPPAFTRTCWGKQVGPSHVQERKDG